MKTGPDRRYTPEFCDAALKQVMEGGRRSNLLPGCSQSGTSMRSNRPTSARPLSLIGRAARLASM